MKLSKRTRYGLHALIDLVIHAKTEQIALNSIAQRNGISEQYLEQIFSALRRARIVKSVKGAQGGYFLEKDPSDITVSEVVEVLEGNYFLEDEAGGTEEGRRVIQELIVERVNKRLKGNFGRHYLTGSGRTIYGISELSAGYVLYMKKIV